MHTIVNSSLCSRSSALQQPASLNDAIVRSQDAEAGSSPAQWRVVWLERENGGAGFSGNWAGFSKDQVQLCIRPYSFMCLWVLLVTWPGRTQG